MSRHIPYFDFYPADFMNGVRGLSAQEVGVYTMILCRIYEESGPIEFHVTRLSTYCGMRPATFEKTIGRLVDLGKFTLSGGVLSNRRAEVEIQSRADKLKNNVRAGKASAQKRQENQSTEATGVQQSFNQAEAEAEADKTTLSSVVGAQPFEDFGLLQSKMLEALGEDKIQPHGAMVVGPIVELISAGVNLDLDILPTLRARSAKMQRPAGSWAYFVQPIREAYERRVSAGRDLPKPKELETTDEAWAKRLRFARSRRQWSTVEWGPMPGERGCAVPSRLLDACDGQGWSEPKEARHAA
ncbi:DUF1376 domain-containing protein [Rhizobium sp. Root483D2]|uniref:DUF1376 domain-containing protein n=1 Tax=Rhizobium sp. Root483D2 TaxID=1736545 RepID=UPI000714D251|nr:DUF1376 domain-containing protein [Rhizobium sp. Root483D2]KQY20252.1 hypothetical protein ASD32_07245 [Rhizobium sp. Root483D2]